jgi:hypothetical protein
MNRTPSKTFTELIVWQKAHAFVLSAYKLTEAFPKSEIYGLSSQLRRAAVSIPANIAEGYKKRGPADKARFMNMAQGSLEEVQYSSFSPTTSPTPTQSPSALNWTKSPVCSRPTPPPF